MTPRLLKWTPITKELLERLPEGHYTFQAGNLPVTFNAELPEDKDYAFKYYTHILLPAEVPQGADAPSKKSLRRILVNYKEGLVTYQEVYEAFKNHFAQKESRSGCNSTDLNDEFIPHVG